MSIEPSAGPIVNGLGGVFLVVLGALVLLVRPRQRAQTIFAVFTLLYGGTFAISNVGNMLTAGDPRWDLIQAISNGLSVAASVALVVLAVTYPRPLGRGDAHHLILPALMSGLLLKDWLALPHPRSPPAFAAFIVVAFAFALLLFASRAVRSSAPAPERERRDLMLMSAGLLVFPAVAAGLGLPAGTPFAFLLYGVLVVFAAVWFAAVRRGEAAERRAGRHLALFALTLPFAGFATTATVGTVAEASRVGVLGVARILTALILSYAILRHRLLGIDVRVKWTIRQSTVAAIFVAVFLAVAQVAQEVVSDTFGLALGGVAAGALVFALHPLQRFGERVASAAMPGVKAPGEMSPDERAAVYRGLAEVAWADGSLSGDERMMLEEARARLGLDAARAAAIEREVLAAKAKGVG